MLASINTGEQFFLVGRKWDIFRKIWAGFVASTCLNDPGHISQNGQFLSTLTRDLVCCVNDVCYENLVKAVVRKNEVFGLFHDHRNSTSAICRFSSGDFETGFGNEISYAYSSDGRTVKEKNPINVANCPIYNNLKEVYSENEAEMMKRHFDISTFATKYKNLKIE